MLFIGSCQHLSHFALLSAPGALKRYGIKRPVYRKGAWIIGKKKGTGAAMQDRLWHWKIGQPSKETMNPQNDKISRVYRSKAQAKESYDRISRFYDHIAGTFEKRHRNKTLERLNIRRGDTVLEIGFGTGHCLKQIAESVGENGRVYGIDISSGMLKVSKQRLDVAGLLERVELCCGDAAEMPYEGSKFDAVFMSFTLELFDTPEIPIVLAETGRVLKENGKVGIVGISKEDGDSMLMRLYEWAHEKFPKYADCRPIYVEQSIRDAGFEIEYKEKLKLVGLPGEIVIGVKTVKC